MKICLPQKITLTWGETLFSRGANNRAPSALGIFEDSWKFYTQQLVHFKPHFQGSI